MRQAVCAEVWLRALEKKVKVVVMAGIKEPILLLSTALALSMTQRIELYAARFTRELTIRHLKENFGVAHYQFFPSIAIHRFFHLAALAFSLCRLTPWHATASEWLPAPSPSLSPLSFSHLRQALKHFLLTRILASKFGLSPNSDASSPELDAVLRLAA